MPTPDELRAQADELDRQGYAAADAGDSERAAALFGAATGRRETAKIMEAGLPGREQGGRVEGDMFTAPTHALATSYGRAQRYDNRLAKAAARKGFTLRELSKALTGTGTSVASLSSSQRPKKDPHARPIRRSVARQIAKLIGYEATEGHYPAGILDEK